MAYHLHIVRTNPIGLEEWSGAVTAIQGVRLSSHDVTANNPETGETIELPSQDGDAEVFFSEEERWYPCFFFAERISFKAPEHWQETECHIRRIAFELADLLNAVVQGDEGERYDRNGALIRNDHTSPSQDRPARKRPWWRFWS